jgi:hypothetical protein
MIRQSIVRTVFGFTALFSLSVSAQLTISPPNPAVKARIGIVLPKAQLAGESSETAAEAVRELIASYLAGPVLEIVPLEARISAQVDAEANGRNCTHVLYTSLEQEKRNAKGIFSKVAKTAGVLPSLPKLGGLSGSTTAIQAIDNLLRDQAGSVKAKDEFTLQYRLLNVGGETPPLEDTLSAKAKEDGEDLLSQLAEQLATITLTSTVGQ